LRPAFSAARVGEQGRGVEIVVTQALLGQRVQRLCPDRAAERAGGTETQVVDQDDHDVGRAIRRFHLEARRRLCIARVQLLVGRSSGLGHRQHGAVQGNVGGGRHGRNSRQPCQDGRYRSYRGAGGA
jgi:hypothetical protein